MLSSKKQAQFKTHLFFVSKALIGVKTQYPKIKNISLTLIMASRKLVHYFLEHTIFVRTNLPLKQVLYIPYLSKQMTKWSIEIFEFDVSFEPRKALKAQVFAHFLEKMTSITLEPISV